MSIMRMRKMFRNPIKLGGKRHWWASPMFLVFVGIIFIFVVGAFYSFGPGGRSGSESEKSQGARNVSKVVATVDGTSITRQEFEARYAIMSHNAPGGSSLTEARYMKTNLLDGLIDRVLTQRAEKKEGVKVSGKQIAEKRDKMADDSINQEFPDRKDLLRFLKKKQMSYEQYKDKLLTERFNDDKAIREQLMEEELEKTIKDRVKPTEDQIKDSYTEVKARHILIKPDDYKKKIQAQEQKEGKQQQQVQQDWDGMAKKKVEDLLTQVKAGADFAKLADENTDDPSGKGKGGDLGWFKRGMMVPEFDTAAFQLQVGQVSEVIKTDFGYHIIKVDDRRQTLPADFDKDKQKYIAQVTDELKNRAWAEYKTNMKKQAKIEIIDSELKAYSLMKEGKEAEAAAYLDQAMRQDPQNMSVRWELAQMFQTANQKDKAMELLAQIVQSEQGSGSPQVRMTYGKMLQDSGKIPEAIEQYKSASDWAASMDFQNYFTHSQLKKTFADLKQPDLVNAEDQWLADFQKQQQEGGGGMGPMGGMMPMQMPMQVPGQ